ncbi:MAG TPA: VOC family protein [Candidatus Limnocylindrales bacterium]
MATYPVIVELFVRDLAASRASHEALGFRATNGWRNGAWMEREGVGIRLELDDHVSAGPHYFTPNIGRHPRGTGVEIVVQVSDVTAIHDAAIRAGLNVVRELRDRPWNGRDFRLADPDGSFIGITSPFAAEP